MMPQLHMPLVHDVAALLKQSDKRIVFAESCTAGLVSASLARVPGISEFLCGSAVVYRIDTKAKWLGIREDVLQEPGPVSSLIASQMAEHVLALTPEADLAASITGHLGPGAPPDLDGVIYIAVARRNVTCKTAERATSQGSVSTIATRHQLPIAYEHSSLLTATYVGDTLREQRQWHAVQLILETVRDQLLLIQR
jgi:PncC family amidohydrolase